ncbi:MAG: hypothetical protein DDT21_02311 [Syntrophomonadaceae bacterium]|nr:hypothetical protein [Bacillota bacterium]
MQFPRIRWAVLVAGGGLLAAQVPGLSDYLQMLFRIGGPLLCVLLVAAKLVSEAMVSIDQEDPMYYTQERGTPLPGFWRRIL